MNLLHERSVKHVRLVNLVAAPEGIRRVRRHYPDLPIFTAAVDRWLNERGYMLPGLGRRGRPDIWGVNLFGEAKCAITLTPALSHPMGWGGLLSVGRRIRRGL